MAATEWYVDGTGGNDTTGDGSKGSPWKTIQHFIATATTGQPNRLNVKNSETLTASLDFTTRPMTLTADNYLLIQGYTTNEGDGGIFNLAGGGNTIVAATSINGLNFRNIKFTDWGSGYCLRYDNNNSIVECEFDGEGVRQLLFDLDFNTAIVGNKIHRIALNGRGISLLQYSTFYGNYYQIDSATSADEMLYMSGGACNVQKNVFSVKTDSTMDVIEANGDGCAIINNTIYNQSAGTGSAIILNTTSVDGITICNNIIEGFIGTNGAGVEVIAGAVLAVYGNNKFYNNANNEVFTGEVVMNLGGNETLGGSPFTSTDNADHNDDDFTLTSSYLAASYPSYPTELYDPDDTQEGRNQNTQDVGALQSTPSGGGAGDTIVVKQNVRY